jgi:uncharacterized membrane protein YjjB (DUF3815 family)
LVKTLLLFHFAPAPLGTARLIYAGLIVVAISVGLLFGLSLLGVSLPADPPGRAVPLWQDVIAAGVAVAAYNVFFSTPLRMLPWPVAVGMFAHALRWVALSAEIAPYLPSNIQRALTVS